MKEDHFYLPEIPNTVRTELILLGFNLDDYYVWMANPCVCKPCNNFLADTTYFVSHKTDESMGAIFCTKHGLISHIKEKK